METSWTTPWVIVGTCRAATDALALIACVVLIGGYLGRRAEGRFWSIKVEDELGDGGKLRTQGPENISKA